MLFFFWLFLSIFNTPKLIISTNYYTFPLPPFIVFLFLTALSTLHAANMSTYCSSPQGFPHPAAPHHCPPPPPSGPPWLLKSPRALSAPSQLFPWVQASTAHSRAYIRLILLPNALSKTRSGATREQSLGVLHWLPLKMHPSHCHAARRDHRDRNSEITLCTKGTLESAPGTLFLWD